MMIGQSKLTEDCVWAGPLNLTSPGPTFAIATTYPRAFHEPNASRLQV